MSLAIVTCDLFPPKVNHCRSGHKPNSFISRRPDRLALYVAWLVCRQVSSGFTHCYIEESSTKCMGLKIGVGGNHVDVMVLVSSKKGRLTAVVCLLVSGIVRVM